MEETEQALQGENESFTLCCSEGAANRGSISLESEMSPCLAHSLPDLAPKLDFPTDLQLCQWDTQDFKENYSVHLWAQLQSFLKKKEKVKVFLPPVFSIQHVLHTPTLF